MIIKKLPEKSFLVFEKIRAISKEENFKHLSLKKIISENISERRKHFL